MFHVGDDSPPHLSPNYHCNLQIKIPKKQIDILNGTVEHSSGHFIGFLFFAVCGATHAALTLAASLYYGLNRTWYHYYGDGTEPKVQTPEQQF